MHTEQYKCKMSSQITYIIDIHVIDTITYKVAYMFSTNNDRHPIIVARVCYKRTMCIHISHRVYHTQRLQPDVFTYKIIHKRTSTQKKDMDVQLHLVFLASQSSPAQNGSLISLAS